MSSLLTHRRNLLSAHVRGSAGSKQFYSNSETVLSGAQIKNAIPVDAFISTMRSYWSSDCIVTIHDLFIVVLRF